MLSIAIITMLFAQIFSGGPALAAGNSTAHRPSAIPTELITIRGTVNATSADSITIGSTTVTVRPATRYHIPGIPNATLADIRVGMHVTALIERIKGHVYAAVINVIPITRYLVGKVTAYNYDPAKGGNISIEDRSGTTHTFDIATGNFSIRPQGGTITIGEHVTVVTRQLTPDDTPVAIGVVVSPTLAHYSGNVTAFSYNPATGGGISIEQKGGQILTFEIAARRFSMRPKGAEVKIGSHIIIVVQTPANGSAPVAIAVYVAVPTTHFTGKVTEFTYNPAHNGRISILEKDGKRLNFRIESGNFTIRPVGANVTVGDMVTVVAKVLEGNHLVAIGVVVLPKLVSVTGTINNIDQTDKTITIGTTVVDYSTRTVFILHGMLSVTQGLQGNAICYEQADGTLLANGISVTTPPIPSPQ